MEFCDEDRPVFMKCSQVAEERLRMLKTNQPLEQCDSSYYCHTSALLEWLATKTRENNARKSGLLELKESLPAPSGTLPCKPHSATIFVVDDEPHIAITLSEILERRGYSAVWFTEPLLALAFMEVHKPDLLLTDVMMPVLDEIELVLQVKRMYSDCPVLIISALGSDTSLAKRIAAVGRSVALEVKPLPITRLLRRIADLISSGVGQSASVSISKDP